MVIPKYAQDGHPFDAARLMNIPQRGPHNQRCDSSLIWFIVNGLRASRKKQT